MGACASTRVLDDLARFASRTFERRCECSKVPIGHLECRKRPPSANSYAFASGRVTALRLTSSAHPPCAKIGKLPTSNLAIDLPCASGAIQTSSLQMSSLHNWASHYRMSLSCAWFALATADAPHTGYVCEHPLTLRTCRWVHGNLGSSRWRAPAARCSFHGLCFPDF
jgi:hypothetical protein